MYRFIVILILLLFFQKSYSQSIEFYKEDIEFTLSKDYFKVDGVYHFCNVNERDNNTMLFYPFPADSINGIIDSIEISNILTGDKIKYIISKNRIGVSFPVKIKAYGIVKYRIKYRQKLFGNSAEYILTTTQYWNKKFESVNYYLTVPNGIIVDKLSYKPDSLIGNDNYIKYFWHKKDFMPDKDFIIDFHSN